MLRCHPKDFPKDFDPAATCPHFLDELLRPALPEEDISLLQRYAGMCLLGGNPAHRFLVLRGTAGGGKSTLVEIIETVIGPHNVAQLRVHLLTERFEISGFLGKTLLCGKDVPGNFLDNRAAHVIKPLTGGDRLSAEQKNVKHRFDVVGDYAVIITTNTRLHVRLDSDTEGWQAVTVRQFESQVCDHMVAIHHAHKRTDIRRNDKNQRGYARVALQDMADSAPSPAPAQPELAPF